MFLHTLLFKDNGSLSRAFEKLMSAQQVEDCMAEPDMLRLRFVARAEPAAELLELIYADGGLTWSTRAAFPGVGRSPAEAIRSSVHTS